MAGYGNLRIKVQKTERNEKKKSTKTWQVMETLKNLQKRGRFQKNMKITNLKFPKTKRIQKKL